MKAHLKDAEPRTCLACGEKYVPVRQKQWFCGKPKACAHSAAAQRIMRNWSCGNFIYAERVPEQLELYKRLQLGMGRRMCERCGCEYDPPRADSKTCGADCPGRSDFELTCADPDCGKKFTVQGNSRGKGNQQYCSVRCRDRVARIRQGQRFRRYDGLSREIFVARGEAQEWKCMVCGAVPEPDGRRRTADELPYLAVDHCHDSGQRRDLLCSRCNLSLGLMDDDPARLRAAAAYLER